jgi:hypothetical protein
MGWASSFLLSKCCDDLFHLIIPLLKSLDLVESISDVSIVNSSMNLLEFLNIERGVL